MPKKSTERGPLSRGEVIEGAMLLADREGIDQLSMRRLGQELGVEAMSLYRHVANKEEILDGIVDRVVEEIDVPRVDGEWREEMRARAESAHGCRRRTSCAALLLISRVNVGPAMLRFVDATIGCLMNAGFSAATADHAWNAIENHIYGYTLQKLNFPFEPEEYAQAAAAFLPQIPQATYPHLHTLSEKVIAGEHDGLHDFSFGLEMILDGLAAKLPGESRYSTAAEGGS